MDEKEDRCDIAPLMVRSPQSFWSLPGGLGQKKESSAAAAAASPVQHEQKREVPLPGALEDTKEEEEEEEGGVNLMQPPARAKKKAKKGKKGAARSEEPSDDFNSEVRYYQTSDRRHSLSTVRVHDARTLRKTLALARYLYNRGA